MPDDKALDAESASEAQAMFDYDITLIQQSSIGNTVEGKEIVALLKAFNKAGRIKYAPLEERGAWDGTDILVSDNYVGKVFPTTCELAHEASHALWRQKNPTKIQTKLESDAEERHAQTVQAKVYVWLRTYRNAPMDASLEKRLAEFGVRSETKAGGTKR